MTEQTDKLTRIAELLLARTREGQTEWEETVDKNTFTTSTEAFSVRVGSLHGTGDYYLGIVNEKGRVVQGASFPPDSEILKALYQAARQNALHVEEVLDNVLRTLGERK